METEIKSILESLVEGDPVNGGRRMKVDAAVTLSPGDIEIGAVEIKDATTDTRVVVKTDGTNNALVVTQNTVPPLVAGAAIIGKVGIDQTTPGTTNNVAIISGQNGVAGGSGVTGATVQRVVLATDVALPAGENVIGSSVGKSVNCLPVITTTSTQYTANDNVGGILTLTGACRVSGGTTTLQSVSVIDTLNQKQPFTVLIFSSNPAAATITDNAAFVWSTDYTKFITKIDVAAGDYESIPSSGTPMGIASLSFQPKVLTAVGSANLFAVVVTTGTPTYGADAISLYVKFGFLQD